jgi:hypothetical protein
LRLTSIQLERDSALLEEAEQLSQTSVLPSTNQESIDFCEVQEKVTYPLAYKPAEAFATNPCVVELYRLFYLGATNRVPVIKGLPLRRTRILGLSCPNRATVLQTAQ